MEKWKNLPCSRKICVRLGKTKKIWGKAGKLEDVREKLRENQTKLRKTYLVGKVDGTLKQENFMEKPSFFVEN